MNQTKQTHTVEAVVEACELYWIGRGMPRPTIDNLSDELRDHLHDATQDGKSITAVTGENIRAFAAAWGQPYTSPPSLRDRVLNWTSISTCVITATLLFKHLYEQALTVPVQWSDSAYILLIIFIPLLMQLITDWTNPLRTKWWQRAEIVGALATMGVVSILAAITLALQHTPIISQPLFIWPWWLTGAMVALTSVLVGVTIRSDPTRPQEHDDRNHTQHSALWFLAGMLGLTFVAMMSVFVAFVLPDTAWRLLPLLLALLSGGTAWLMLIYRLAKCGQ